MDTKELIELKFVDYLEGRLSQKEALELENQIAENQSFKESFEDIKSTWIALNDWNVEGPAEDTTTRFMDTMSDFESKHFQTKSNVQNIRPASRIRDLLKYAAAAVFLLTCGAYIGRMTSKDVKSFDQKSEVVRLSNEVNEMKEMMMLTMIQNPQASDRIRAVNYTKELVEVDDKVIDALLSTFSYDENDNVRIVALNALTKMGNNSRVRESLINAIMDEKSALIQVALADAMIKLQEKKSLRLFKEKIEDVHLNKHVRDKYRRTIEKLSI